MIERVAGFPRRLGEGEGLVPEVSDCRVKVLEHLFDERGPVHQRAALPHHFGLGGPLGGELLGAHWGASCRREPEWVLDFTGIEIRDRWSLAGWAPIFLRSLRVEVVPELVPGHVVPVEIADHFPHEAPL